MLRDTQGCKPCFGQRPCSYALCMKTIRELANFDLRPQIDLHIFIIPLHIHQDTQLTNYVSNNWHPICEKKGKKC